MFLFSFPTGSFVFVERKRAACVGVSWWCRAMIGYANVSMFFFNFKYFFSRVPFFSTFIMPSQTRAKRARTTATPAPHMATRVMINRSMTSAFMPSITSQMQDQHDENDDSTTRTLQFSMQPQPQSSSSFPSQAGSPSQTEVDVDAGSSYDSDSNSSSSAEEQASTSKGTNVAPAVHNPSDSEASDNEDEKSDRAPAVDDDDDGDSVVPSSVTSEDSNIGFRSGPFPVPGHKALSVLFNMFEDDTYTKSVLLHDRVLKRMHVNADGYLDNIPDNEEGPEAAAFSIRDARGNTVARMWFTDGVACDYSGHAAVEILDTVTGKVMEELHMCSNLAHDPNNATPAYRCMYTDGGVASSASFHMGQMHASTFVPSTPWFMDPFNALGVEEELCPKSWKVNHTTSRSFGAVIRRFCIR